MNDLCSHSPAEGEVAQAAAGLRGASTPRRRHPPILCHQRAERSSPACGRAAGWRAARLWLCFPVLSLIASPPLLRPPLGAGSHSASMMSSGGNLPCSKAGIIQRSRGEQGAGAEAAAEPLGARTQNLPGQDNWGQGQSRGGGVLKGGSEGECGQGGRGGGKSPGRKVRWLLQRFLTWCVVKVGRKFP